MKILTNYRLHFHEVEYFHKVECTGGSFPRGSLMGWNFSGENFPGGNFPRIQYMIKTLNVIQKEKEKL